MEREKEQFASRQLVAVLQPRLQQCRIYLMPYGRLARHLLLIASVLRQRLWPLLPLYRYSRPWRRNALPLMGVGLNYPVALGE